MLKQQIVEKIRLIQAATACRNFDWYAVYRGSLRAHWARIRESGSTRYLVKRSVGIVVSRGALMPDFATNWAASTLRVSAASFFER